MGITITITMEDVPEEAVARMLAAMNGEAPAPAAEPQPAPAPEAPAKRPRDKGLINRIRKVLEEADGGLTTAQIANAVGRPGETNVVGPTLRKMEENDEVSREETTPTKGGQKRYLWFIEEAED